MTLAYMRFTRGEEAVSTNGHKLPAPIAAAHWVNHVQPGAFGMPISITEKQQETVEAYPGSFYITHVETDQVYTYVTGPADIIREAAQLMGYTGHLGDAE